MADADWLSPGDALRAILADVAPLPAETRPLLDALGRVLAADVIADVALPPWDNSAMDGFAARAGDVRGASEGRPRVLRVVDDIPAGAFPSRAVRAGEAARIMTGAPVPDGADTVVRVEHTDGGGEARVAVLRDDDAGRNIRPRGEDVRPGDLVLRAGTVLRAPHLAVAASVGRAALSVVRRPVVAVLASGDELVPVERFDEVRAGRRIVSSNSYALAAQLAEIGCEARLLGIAGDTPASLRAHLETAVGCDAVVTTAGVSVGEHDHVRGAMEGLGARVAFWRMRARPGSALAYGRVHELGGIPWFGLPGNPVSTMVTFALFARPALLRMAGHARVHLPARAVRMEDAYSAKGALTHFPRVRLSRDGDGWTARLTGGQGSGIATSVARADGLLIVPEGTEIRPGDTARVLLWDGDGSDEEPAF